MAAEKPWESPDWHTAGKTHDWRNHVPEHIRAIWSTFDMWHRAQLYKWADALADAEIWE